MDLEKAIIGVVGALIGTLLSSLFGLLKVYVEDNLSWKKDLKNYLKEANIINGLIPIIQSVEGLYDIFYEKTYASIQTHRIPKSLFKRFDRRFNTEWLPAVEYLHRHFQNAAQQNTAPSNEVMEVEDQLYEEVFFYYNVQLNNPILSWWRLLFIRLFAYWNFYRSRKARNKIVFKSP